ncbi:MAG: helix-turn-helix transcriptional regulator [Oscillospiraceae bacterium]|nr:helix-turn-helix transcriptional regulator [Oscillospiraceae bacterium]
MGIHHEIITKNYTIRLQKGRVHPNDHWHQRTEFLLVHSGNCRVWIGKEEYRGKPGDIFVIHSGEIHALTCEENCFLYICTFDPSVLYSFQPVVQFLQSYISAEALEQIGLLEQVRGVFAEMLQEQNQADNWHDVLIRSDIIRLYSLFARHFPREVSSSKQSMTKFLHFQQALSFIAEHYGEDIKLSDVAKTINYNPSYVSSLFVTYCGVNFKSYLDRFRINKAVELLQKTSTTIAEISALCGYENIRTFNNTFKRVTQMTPSQMRAGRI